MSISPGDVMLQRLDRATQGIRNDAVIVQIGGTPPTQLLTSSGIDIVTKHGQR
jgi:hypothetical protein